MKEPQVVLITGGSRGFGEAAGQLIADRGHTVVCTMRKPERDAPGVIAGREEHMHPVQLDVLDGAAVTRVVAEVIERFGRIDVLINNAGYGLQGSTEDCSEEEVWRSLDTNFIGQLRMMRAVLPHMRGRGRGKIINVSSTAGRLAGGLGGFYSSTKHAVEAMSEAARYELHGSGVEIGIIEPGMFRSDWQTTNLDVCEAFRDGRAIYQDVMERSLVAFRELAATRPGSASVAAAMADMVELPDPLPLRWPVGNDSTHQLPLRHKTTDEEWDVYRSYVGYGRRGGQLSVAPESEPDPRRSSSALC